MANTIFTKDDICLLISALASYVEHSKLKASLDFDKVYLYTNSVDYERHFTFLSHSRDLQVRLIDLLNNFD